jgi:hypothetical protein
MFESPANSVGQYGRSSTERLRSAFPGSPINIGRTDKINSFDRNGVRRWYSTNVLRGETNDGGHTFGTFDMNYTTAPNYDDVESGAAGKPASAWVPNPSSPGEGNGVNPASQSEAPENFGNNPSDTPFEGEGSQLSPEVSSKRTVARMYVRDFLRGS